MFRKHHKNTSKSEFFVGFGHPKGPILLLTLEVENGCFRKVPTIGGTHFLLPCLWEEGYTPPKTIMSTEKKGSKAIFVTFEMAPF